MKEEPPYNPYTFDPYEPHPRDLESAIGRFLGFLFGIGIGIPRCRDNQRICPLICKDAPVKAIEIFF